MGKERKVNNPDQKAKGRIIADLGHETLPWMNGKRIQVELEPMVGASSTVYVGSITETYAGDGGISPTDPSAFEAFRRVAQAISNVPGFRSDDCLTQNTGDKRVPKGPAVRAHLIGRNAKGSASFIYFADTRIQDSRSLLYLGASLGDRRTQFQSRLASLSYSSAGNVANSGRRMH